MSLSIKHLDVSYKLTNGLLRAVQDLSLDLEEEGSLGIVGESACGKSTLAFSIIRTLPDNAIITNGEILLDGVDIVKLSKEDMRKIRWSKISIILQSGMNALDPVIKIKDQLYEPLKTHTKLTEKEMNEKILEVFNLVRLPHINLNSYPHELSGGMKQRVMIAMSLICNPKIVIADEPTTALDVVVQREILRQIINIQKQLGFSLIMISHDLASISETCQDIVIMYGGRILEYGKTRDVITEPRHPYTVALLESFPSLKGPPKKVRSIPGIPPDLRHPISGCVFKPRCKLAQDKCLNDPPLVSVYNKHFSRCFFSEELRTKSN